MAWKFKKMYILILNALFWGYKREGFFHLCQTGVFWMLMSLLQSTGGEICIGICELLQKIQFPWGQLLEIVFLLL